MYIHIPLYYEHTSTYIYTNIYINIYIHIYVYKPDMIYIYTHIYIYGYTCVGQKLIEENYDVPTEEDYDSRSNRGDQRFKIINII